MAEQHTLLWESGSSSAPLPPLVDLSYVTHEEHPTPAPGNHFQVKVVQRRLSSFRESQT